MLKMPAKITQKSNNKSKNNGKKLSTKKKILIVAGSFVALILIVALSGYLYLNNMLGKIKYDTGSSGGTAASAPTKTTSGESLFSSSDVYNVLLIGSDTRNTDEQGRSDSMILVSINSKTKQIVMTSFMRDMYVSIPGHGQNRINAANAFGGPQLLIQTLDDNFKIKIDSYVSVDFFSFMKIIDALHGVNINVTSAELPVLNDYVQDINNLKKLPSDDGKLKNTGNDLLLTGKQALAYSRIRYVGHADFQRTERQRTVLNQVITKMKKQNLLEINDIMNMLLPDVVSSIPKDKMMALSLNALTYLNYDVVQDRIPIDGSYKSATINSMDVLTVDLDKNSQELQNKIYRK